MTQMTQISMLGALCAVVVSAGPVFAQKIERINPPGLSTPTTYSHIVKVGDIL